MEKEDIPTGCIYGRKIFFIAPSMAFKKNIIDSLRNMEYEIYVISNYKCAKATMQNNPKAMFFISIDNSLNYEQWYKFLKSIELDPILKDVFIGLVSKDISEKKYNFFSTNTQLQGGLIKIDMPQEELIENIKALLDTNHAKGKRQYIRIDCVGNKNINAYMAFKDKLFSIDILNISSAGMAIKTSPELANAFLPNTVVKNISLSIYRQTVVISGIVFYSEITEDKRLKVVLLIGMSIKAEEKNSIRNFIFDNLDSKMKVELDTCLLDNTDYDAIQLPENCTPFRK